MAAPDNKTTIEKDPIKYKTIIKATKQVLTENGINNLSIDEVASRANLGKGTVYRYFGSKDNLLLTIVEDTFTELIVETNYINSNNDDIEVILNKIADMNIDFMGSNSWFFQISVHFFKKGKQSVNENDDTKQMFKCSPVFNKLKKYKENILNTMEELFQKLKDKGRAESSFTSRELSFMLWAVVKGVLEEFVIGDIDYKTAQNFLHRFNHNLVLELEGSSK